MPNDRPQKNVAPQAPPFFFQQKRMKLQCKVLDPRAYVVAMGGTYDREELAWEP